MLEYSSSSVIFCILTKFCQENVHMPMKNIFFTHIKLYIATKKNIWCLWVKTLLVLTNNHSIKKRNQLILRALAYTWQSPVLFLSQGLAISWKIRCLLKLKFPSEFEKSDSFCCVFVLFFSFPPHWKWYYLATRTALWASQNWNTKYFGNNVLAHLNFIIKNQEVPWSNYMLTEAIPPTSAFFSRSWVLAERGR